MVTIPFDKMAIMLSRCQISQTLKIVNAIILKFSVIVTALFNNLHKLFAYFTPVNHNYDDNRLTTETDKAD